MSMDTTRVIQPGETTQMLPASPLAPDPQRTVMGLPPTSVTAEMVPGNRYAFSGGSSREHALIFTNAGGAMGGMIGRRAPLNICLVIDRSGSMEGEPLEYVKRACGYVVDLLEPQDVLSVVTFEESVDVIMPARRVVNKDLIKQHIQRIQPGNTTNLYDGIVAGASQVGSVGAEGYVKRLIVLTDGEPTAGIKDFHSIVGMVQEQKSRGISTTALGFGPEYNEELLAGMARRSGGNYYYVSRPELIPEVFRAEVDTLLTLVARNVRLRLQLSRWAQVRQVFGAQPTFSERVVEAPLPDLERGAVLSTLVELELGPRPAGTYRVARMEFVYDDCVSGAPEQRLLQDLVFEFTPDLNLVASGKNATVQRELEIAMASRNLERTMMGIKTQQLTGGAALHELQRTQMLLTQAGRTEQAQELTQAMQDLQRGGGNVEKTLIGTIMDLDLGKRKGG